LWLKKEFFPAESISWSSGPRTPHDPELVKNKLFLIEKGLSWLGLWETNKVITPYHPSLRHIAFRVDFEEFKMQKNG